MHFLNDGALTLAIWLPLGLIAARRPTYSRNVPAVLFDTQRLISRTVE